MFEIYFVTKRVEIDFVLEAIEINWIIDKLAIGSIVKKIEIDLIEANLFSRNKYKLIEIVEVDFAKIEIDVFETFEICLIIKETKTKWIFNFWNKFGFFVLFLYLNIIHD